MPVKFRISHQIIGGSLPAAFLASLLLAGCGESPEAGKANSQASPNAGSHDDHGHEHPTEGPHHGHLVELGNEEYHAEIVHDEAGSVTVYLLDGSAKTAIAIDAAEVAINLSHEGKAEQFKLPASPDSNDPKGRSSRFVSRDKHLGEDLDAKGSAAKLVVTINGKQYSGKIDHDHDDHKH